MKNIKLWILALLIVPSNTLVAENVELKFANNGKNKSQNKIPIPVDVGYDDNDSKLNIHFTESIVYQQQITAPKGQSVSVNLQPFQEGEYTITFQDAKGNEVEGTFTKETEN